MANTGSAQTGLIGGYWKEVADRLPAHTGARPSAVIAEFLPVFDITNIGTAGHERTIRETAQTQAAIIKCDGAGDRDIDAEFGWNLDDMGATVLHLLGQGAPFSAEDIGGAQRVFEGGQIDGFICQFDADELALGRHAHGVDIIPFIEGDMAGGFCGVGLEDVERLVGGIHREGEAGTKGVTGAQDRSEIHRLGNSLGADGKISAHAHLLFHVDGDGAVAMDDCALHAR